MNGDTGPQLRDEDFAAISRLIYQTAGIRLSDAKRELVKSRLRGRLRELGLGSFGEYVSRVEGRQHADELSYMVDALTTNETRFFRESAHFDFLAQHVFAKAQDEVKIWSSACSTGQEPYSIAMQAVATPPPRGAKSVRILATDIDSKVLAKARTAEYDEAEVKKGSEAERAQGFDPIVQRPGWYRVQPQARHLVQFARLNLMGAWPMKGPFDVIFCRNVMIYFDGPTRTWLSRRMGALLRPGGFLFIGHAESLGVNPSGFRSLRPAVYQRTDAPIPMDARPDS